MTKEQMLDLLRLLAAMESAMLISKVQVPDYIMDQLCSSVDALSKGVLK